MQDQDDDEIFIYEERILDTLTVSAPKIGSEKEYALKRYNASRTRINDLLHTKLDISFDWENQYVLGLAELDFAVIRDNDALQLDAREFDIHSVELNGNKISNYNYQDPKLTIPLGKEYKRGEKFSVKIDYTAKTAEGTMGGSAAITSDRGLFFINHDGKTPNKPQQIWTQGETENNSNWFPTIDSPNERCSQEIYMTVKDKFASLSNGALISSKKNPNGTRTDYWKQEKAHAPYLFFVGVGDFAIVKEKWKNKDLLYYVEKEYEPYAKEIFAHTPEMLSFFSDLLDYEYPWDKYAQLVGRDYVSGAMENTGAVIFGDAVQKTDRELIDNDNDYIVAHEMFHHWFGDLVTCESWANLTMNEGFANYGEYLWFEHKYGLGRANHHRVNELNGYLQSAAQQGKHDLIYYDYKDKEETFDAHSYNKGGLVLHMLRNYLGDKIFFLGLNKYLVDNAYTDVEADELRLSMEDVSGEDLNWFFDQWYFSSGHPDLDIQYNYNQELKQLTVEVEQTQDPEENVPVYILPMDIAVYYENGNTEMFPRTINKRKQTFIIEDVMKAPAFTSLDGKNILLGTKKENKTQEQYIAQFLLSENFQDKYEAIRKIDDNNLNLISVQALKEDRFYFRKFILKKIDDIDLLKKLVENDPHSSVRMEALSQIKSVDNNSAIAVSNNILGREKSFKVIGKAIETIASADLNMAIDKINGFSEVDKKALFGIITRLYAKTGEVKYLKFFEKHVDGVGFDYMFNFFDSYYKLATKADPQSVKATADILKGVSLTETAPFYKKYLSTNMINRLKNDLIFSKEDPKKVEAQKHLEGIIQYIKENETNESLKERYLGF